jgi:hypothetical protein
VSQINFASINENFPVAGQDNDTQVFRDNFDTIKTNFRLAQEEISDLENNTARTDQETEFNNNIVSTAVFRNNRDIILDGGAISVNQLGVDYANGNYQIFRIGADVTLGLLGLPTDTSFPRGVGKITLELYSDGAARTITLDPSNAVIYKKKSSDSTFTWSGNIFTVSSSSDPVIIEIWRHSSETVFVNYLGTFA